MLNAWFAKGIAQFPQLLASPIVCCLQLGDPGLLLDERSTMARDLGAQRAQLADQQILERGARLILPRGDGSLARCRSASLAGSVMEIAPLPI